MSRLGRRRRSFDGANVFITGAGSGIGRATALHTGRLGARLHLTDISSVGLASTAAEVTAAGGTVVLAETADVASYDEVRALAARVTAESGPMDVVMNIAGVSAWGTISSLRHETWQRMVEVNLMGPIHVLESLVPAMVEGRRGGHVVNVSSAAGLIGMPWHAAYSASKFGLRGVSEVLRFDLERHRIGVSLVCPGAVATPLTETVQIDGIEKANPRFLAAQARFRRHACSPEDAAAAIVAGVERNRYWVYTSTDIRLAHLLQRVAPPLYALVMRVLNAQANRVLPEVRKARRPA